MPRAFARRGPRPLTRLSFQVLDVEFAISTPSTEVAETVRMLDQSARHDFQPTRTVDYEIEPVDGGFAVAENGVPFGPLPYPIDVLMLLESRIYGQALTGIAGMAVLAACVRVEGGRLLLVGDRDSRLTAFLLALLRDGAGVEGDWSVVVDGEVVTAVARPLRVQEDALAAYPAAAELLERRPRVQDAIGRVIWSFDPTTAGFPWEIARAPVAGVVVVESNPGGRSRLEPCPRYETVQDVVGALAAPSGAGVAAACRLVDACACGRLRLGDLGEASELLRGSLAQLN